MISRRTEFSRGERLRYGGRQVGIRLVTIGRIRKIFRAVKVQPEHSKVSANPTHIRAESWPDDLLNEPIHPAEAFRKSRRPRFRASSSGIRLYTCNGSRLYCRLRFLEQTPCRGTLRTQSGRRGH